MTAVIVIFGIVTLLGLLFSLYQALRVSSQRIGTPARVLLILAILMLLVVATGNIMEHGVDYALLDAFEGYTAAMALPMLLFFMLTVEMHRELLRANAAALRERRLRDELDHRVRNNLAAVLGLIDVTRQQGEPHDVELFSDLIRSRVLTLSTTHEILSSRRGHPVHLGRLCERMLATFGSNDLMKRVTIEGPDTVIATHLAAGLAIPLHELYQPLAARPDAHAHLSWNRVDDELHMTWRVMRGGDSASDHGMSPVSREMIQGFVKHELRGRLSIQNKPDGEFICTIEFPLLEVREPSMLEPAA